EFTLLNDLMPLSRSVRLEESVYEYARTGGRGWAHTSMSGQIGAALDAKSYTFDGTMVPIHDSGFKFNWRDPVFNKGSALSSLADAQAGSVDDVRRQYVDYIWEGFRDAAGNFIKFDDKTWKGLRHDERVAQVTLTVNFATSTDPKAMRAAAIALRDVLKLQNYQYGQQTWYVSSEIMSNWEQYFDVNALRTVLEELKKLAGISDIKEDAELSGNEIVIIPLAAGVIAPIVGQAFGTVADPRQFYNSDYVWRTWGAAGLMVKQDINANLFAGANFQKLEVGKVYEVDEAVAGKWIADGKAEQSAEKKGEKLALEVATSTVPASVGASELQTKLDDALEQLKQAQAAAAAKDKEHADALEQLKQAQAVELAAEKQRADTAEAALAAATKKDK
ncbi:phage coat protein, partial [Lasius niger]